MQPGLFALLGGAMASWAGLLRIQPQGMGASTGTRRTGLYRRVRSQSKTQKEAQQDEGTSKVASSPPSILFVTPPMVYAWLRRAPADRPPVHVQTLPGLGTNIERR